MSNSSKKVKLGNTYFNQRNNVNRPSATCNITSLAMALSIRGIKGNGKGQLEDQLFNKAASLGVSIHEPTGIKAVAESFSGIECVFRADGSIADIKAALDRGNVCVVHGYFTASGHIVAVVGYDDTSGHLIVDDPWGEWYSTGYDYNPVSGEDGVGNDTLFRYQTFASLCSDTPSAHYDAISDIWFHEVKRKA